MKALVFAEIEAYATAHSMAESDVCRACVRKHTGKWTVLRCWSDRWKGLLESVDPNRAGHPCPRNRHVHRLQRLCFAEALPKRVP